MSKTILPSYELIPISTGIQVVDRLDDTIVAYEPDLPQALSHLGSPCNIKVGDSWGRLNPDGAVTSMRTPALVYRKEQAELKPRKRKNRKFLAALAAWWEENKPVITPASVPVMSGGAPTKEPVAVLPKPRLNIAPFPSPRVQDPPTLVIAPLPGETTQTLPAVTTQTLPALSTPEAPVEETAKDLVSENPTETDLEVAPLEAATEKSFADELEMPVQPKPQRNRLQQTGTWTVRKPEKAAALVKNPAPPKRFGGFKIGALAAACVLLGGLIFSSLIPAVVNIVSNSHPTPVVTQSATTKVIKPSSKVAAPKPVPTKTKQPPAPQPAPEATQEPQPVVTVVAPAPAPRVTVTRHANPAAPAPRPAPQPLAVSNLRTQVSSGKGYITFSAQATGSAPPPITASVGGQTITLAGGSGTVNLPAGHYTWTTSCGGLTNSGSINVY